MADYDFPPDLLDLRRDFDRCGRDLLALHAEFADRPDDAGYRAQVESLRDAQRAAVRELLAHPWPATAPGGATAARMALQQHVARELAATPSTGA